MIKKIFKTAMIGAVIFGIGSCKDYNTDIKKMYDNHKKDIEQLNAKIGKLDQIVSILKTNVENGAYITNVDKNDKTLNISLSNGKTYEIKDGQNGSVVTANPDGFWYIDGQKTEYSWKAENANSTSTSNLIYYKPGEGDNANKWVKVIEDNSGNKTEEPTNINILQEGNSLSAIFDPNTNTLTLNNVSGSNDPITISTKSSSDNQLKYIDFIPALIGDNGVAYIEKKNIAIKQSSTSGSKNAERSSTSGDNLYQNSSMSPLKIRIYPSNTDITGYTFKLYKTTSLSTRATGLTSVELSNPQIENGVVSFDPIADETFYNDQNGEKSAFYIEASKDNNVVLTRNNFYVKVINQDNNNLFLLSNTNKVFRNSLTAAPNGTTAKGSAWLTPSNVSADGATENRKIKESCDIELPYDEQLDLSTLVDGVGTLDQNGNLKKVDVDGLSYEYSIVNNYTLGDAERVTDQSKFVKLSGSILTTQAYWLPRPTPAAIGRTPIVRIKTKLNDKEISTCYIKVLITDSKTPRKHTEDDITINLNGSPITNSGYTSTNIGATNGTFYTQINMSKEEFEKIYPRSKDEKGTRDAGQLDYWIGTQANLIISSGQFVVIKMPEWRVRELRKQEYATFTIKFHRADGITGYPRTITVNLKSKTK